MQMVSNNATILHGIYPCSQSPKVGGIEAPLQSEACSFTDNAKIPGPSSTKPNTVLLTNQAQAESS